MYVQIGMSQLSQVFVQLRRHGREGGILHCPVVVSKNPCVFPGGKFLGSY